MKRGFIYLTVIMLSWKFSLTLDAQFCIETLNHALLIGKPEYSILTKALNTQAMLYFYSSI